MNITDNKYQDPILTENDIPPIKFIIVISLNVHITINIYDIINSFIDKQGTDPFYRYNRFDFETVTVTKKSSESLDKHNIFLVILQNWTKEKFTAK